MRRVLVVLGILIALTMLGVTAFFALQVDAPPVEPSPPADEPPAEPPPKLEPRRTAPPPAEPEKPWRRRTQPAKPPALGCLEVEFQPAPSSGDDTQRRATVFLPTGEALATIAVSRPTDVCRFVELPTGVPLVVRVDAQGYLSGLCCDVVLKDAGVLTKRVELAPAPIVAVRVLEMPRRRNLAGARVELTRGGDVVADGVTDEDGVAYVSTPTVGQLRVRLADVSFPPPEGVVDVWAGDEVVETEFEVWSSGVVEVAVVTASGAPARGVDVWLVGDRATPPTARTDAHGVAMFTNVPGSLDLTAVARADAGVALSRFKSRDGAAQRVPLLLKQQAPLAGDVVDEGGGALAGASVEVVVRPFAEPIATRSDASGHFATPPLPAGLAEVFVRRAGFVDWSAERPVQIDPVVGGYVRARLSRNPTGAVVVAVRDDSGRPLGDVAVALHPSELSSTTSADGMCRIDGLPAGVEQSVVARRRGYRTIRALASPPSVVRVQANVAESAEVVLASIADPAPRGASSATGLVLDSASRPVVGARVEAGAVGGYTADDGSFRLDGLAKLEEGAPLEIRVTPDRWTLEPFRCYVDADPSGALSLGTVRLRSRPYALLRLPPTTARFRSSARTTWAKAKSNRPNPKPAYGAGGPVSPFWVSYNHDDELLGRRTRRFDAFPCVSYDGTWLHLPPADDWKRDGRGEVFVAAPTPRGLVSGGATWTQTADAAPALTLALSSTTGKFTVFFAPNETSARRATFRQIACAALFDPRSIHVPTGDEQRPVDPFASVVGCRTFVVDDFKVGSTVEGLAPGRWRVDLGGVSTEATVPDEVRIYLSR